MDCSLWIVLNELFSMDCSLWIVLHELFSMDCSLWIVLHELFSMNCSLWIVLYELFSMNCSPWIVLHELFSMNCSPWILIKNIYRHGICVHDLIFENILFARAVNAYYARSCITLSMYLYLVIQKSKLKWWPTTGNWSKDI